jgi:hypothetical protein
MQPALPGYAERPDAFRNRWRLEHFRFRWSSWVLAALPLALVGWIAWALGDAQLALKGLLAVIALVAVLPLARDFLREQCVLCDAEPDRIAVAGDKTVTACHRCRVFKVDSPPLPL